jgi:hypothetical protein
MRRATRKVRPLSQSGGCVVDRSIVLASSIVPFTSLLLARRFVRRKHRRLLASRRGEVLEVPYEVLSRTTGRPS